LLKRDAQQIDVSFMHARHEAEDDLDTALDALATGETGLAVLDQLPVPIYTTDETGAVTYWNRACAEFAGREPKLGEDRWCVTWQLYTTDGERLPHAQCPMAQAIRQEREIRGSVAVAVRPDGTRRAFRPYPTPMFDDHGKLTGAVNMLVDITAEQAQVLAEQAQRCRRLADATYDRQTCGVLTSMADQFAKTAAELSN
jgi:PAS domain S-box-containing protein